MRIQVEMDQPSFAMILVVQFVQWNDSIVRVLTRLGGVTTKLRVELSASKERYLGEQTNSHLLNHVAPEINPLPHVGKKASG
jgi:hypothetical protein